MRPFAPRLSLWTPLATFEEDIAALHAQSFGWAMACCGRRRDEAADVLQQAYFKVFSGRAKFEGRSSLRTWLFGVIRLTALESRRVLSLRWLRSARDVESTNDGSTEHDVASDAPSPSESIADRQRAALVESALTTLPSRQRELLHLVFYEGLTLREAAEIMDISLGSASQHYERGKTRLLQILTEKGVS